MEYVENTRVPSETLCFCGFIVFSLIRNNSVALHCCAAGEFEVAHEVTPLPEYRIFLA